MSLTSATTHKRRTEIAEWIALDCGWSGLNAMKRSLRRVPRKPLEPQPDGYTEWARNYLATSSAGGTRG